MRTTRWSKFAVIFALGVTPVLLGGCGAQATHKKSAQVKAGDMPEGGSWTGVFFNPVFGHLHLVHNGANMSGKWKTSNGAKWGELNGPVVGNLFHFEWKEHTIGLVGASALRSGKGYFVYVRPQGENVDDELQGEWGLGGDETGDRWDCVKQRNVTPNPDSIGAATEAGGVQGDWK